MTRWRLGLARSATLVATILFWTWVALKAVVTSIGATTVVDDYNLFVERLPAILGWLFTTPWWVPAGLATVLTGFLIWLSWPKSRAEISETHLGALPPPASVATVRVISASIVVNADPTRNQNAQYRARFARSGRDIAFYVDYRYFSPSLTRHSWTERERIPLLTLDRFAQGERVTLPVLTRYDIDGAPQWRWGEGERPADPRYNFFPNAWHQGRVAAVLPDGSEEYCYFIVRPWRSDAEPEVIGEHMFKVAAEWERGEPVTANASSLFQ